MSRFAKLADKPKEPTKPLANASEVIKSSASPQSRIGRKAISGYLSPPMSLALRT